METNIKIPTFLFVVISAFCAAAFGYEKTPTEYANEIIIDVRNVKDAFLESRTLEKKIAFQLFGIDDPEVRIQTYGIIKQSNVSFRRMMFTNLERSLVFSYINSPPLKDKSPIEKSKTIYRFEKEKILNWTAMGDIYYALMFAHLSESQEFHEKTPVEKLKYIESLKEYCPWMVVTGFSKKVYWEMMSNKSEKEISLLQENLKKENIDFRYLE